MTLILAVSATRGVVHHEVAKGSVSSDRFAAFIKGEKAEIGSVAMMDNACFHQTAAVKSAADSNGLKLLFVPPYSPEFNPIEGCFSVLKQALRSRRVDIDVKAVLEHITPTKVAAFFQHSKHHAARVAEHYAG